MTGCSTGSEVMFGLLRGTRERLRRQASDWLARLQGPASDADRSAFRRWYGADPAHAEAFQRAAAGQGMSDILSGTEFARAHTIRQPARPPVYRRPYAIAAGFAAVVVISGAVILGRPGSLMPPAQAQALLFATDVGEIREVPLPDGTQMTLDTKTVVRVEMSGDKRQVTLREGRARFVVTAADQRPLVVEAGPSRVTGRDSTFDVALHEGEATIQPLQGTINVKPTGQAWETEPVRLAPGQAVMVSSSGGRIQARKPSGSEALWPGGRLDFDNIPLDHAIKEANRYSRGRISLAEPSLSRLRVSGTFRAGDLEGLARSLEAAFGLRLVKEGSGHFTLHPALQDEKLPRPKKIGG